jgi:glyoxylase-like metal-dependent hydrolase (beta-lactamase superfamily II)
VLDIERVERMQPASDFDRIASNIAIWHNYDPEVKAELYSTWLIAAGGAYLIDPIALQEPALEKLTSLASVRGIIVTNSNHYRFAAPYAERFSVTIFAHGDTFPNGQLSRLKIVSDGDEICDGLRVIGIAGAPLGEIVLHYSGDGGTLIVGDALINFEPYGFAFLPPKYCTNQTQMRRSLRKLLDYKTKRILFAHGTPILTTASERLRALLNSGSG